MININFSLSYMEIYLIFVNLSTFILYGFDKLQAIRTNPNISRVPELNLLFMSLFGGSIGAILSMLIFRHKIKKLSFMLKYFVIIIIQTALLFYFFFLNKTI